MHKRAVLNVISVLVKFRYRAFKRYFMCIIHYSEQLISSDAIYIWSIVILFTLVPLISYLNKLFASLTNGWVNSDGIKTSSLYWDNNGYAMIIVSMLH